MALRVELGERARSLAARDAAEPSALRQALSSLEGATECFVALEGDHPVGAARFDHLAFDSEIFQSKVARLSLLTASTEPQYAALLGAVLESASRQGFRHLTRRLDARGLQEVRSLERAGFYIVDVGVLFSLAKLEPQRQVGARPVEPHEVEALVEHCGAVFGNSRFDNDAFFSKAGAVELHRRWIRNCCSGRSDVVLIPAADGPVGFITCAVPPGSDTGNIELLGVNERYRGRGLGKLLLSGALAWFSGRCAKVEVRTQLVNRGATAAYEAAGFTIAQGELIYSCIVR